jgi:hypothetical protein
MSKNIVIVLKSLYSLIYYNKQEHCHKHNEFVKSRNVICQLI